MKTCSTRSCDEKGRRARGARDISALAARVNARRPGTFVESYYCDGCLEAAAIRSYSGSVTIRKRKRQLDTLRNKLAGASDLTL